MRQTVRTFTALEISPDIRAAASRLIERLRVAQADVKWESPERFHWTLNFLGEVAWDAIGEVCLAVSRAAARVESFDLVARGAGAFPNVQRPRTVWLGVGEGTAGMVALHDALNEELARLGFRPEGRRFTPHLTIGRVRKSGGGLQELGRLIQQHADFHGGEMIVDEVVVFSSTLDRGGATYSVLGRAELA